MKLTIQVMKDDNIRLYEKVIYCDPTTRAMDIFWDWLNRAVKALG
jgi:hypothetical protein